MNYNDKIIRKGSKDVFHAFMVKDALYDGYYDMPYVPKQQNLMVKKLISYDKTLNHKYEEGEVVHFYIDDQKFDGDKGIWNGLKSKENFKRGFSLDRLNGASAIICPDFSVYYDMPRVMQIWNIYRSRTIGNYLDNLGYEAIPNIRWTDEESYKYAFDGVYKNQVVAVGTLGCSKEKNDKYFLINGFIEMIKRLEPSQVIIYGPICKELNYILEKYRVNYLHFESEISNYFGGVNNGNEE